MLACANCLGMTGGATSIIRPTSPRSACRIGHESFLSTPMNDNHPYRDPDYPRDAYIQDNSKRNVDVINAVNFALLDKIKGKRVAQEKLRSVLRWRKERSRW